MTAAGAMQPFLDGFREVLQRIERVSGFFLQPVEVPGPDIARDLAAFLTGEGRRVAVVEPGASELAWQELAANVVRAAEDAQVDIVIVVGREQLPASIHVGLRILNQARDRIVRKLDRPLLWCGPASFLDTTWGEAPDFWSIRMVDIRVAERAPAPEAEAPVPVEADEEADSTELGKLRKSYRDARKQGAVEITARLGARLVDALIEASALDEASQVLDEVLPDARRGAKADTAAELALLQARVERRRNNDMVAAATLGAILGRADVGAYVRMRAQLELARLLEDGGRLEPAEHAYREVLAMARAASELEMEARALIGAYGIAARTGRAAEAEGPLGDAVAIARRLGDGALLSAALSAQSLVALGSFDTARGERKLEEARAVLRSAPRDGRKRVVEGGAVGPADVLVLTALEDELSEVLSVGSEGRSPWVEQRDLGGFRYYRRELAGARGSFVVAAAWIGEMGGRAAAIRGQQLLAELEPSCLAMCGICAGDRKKVSLGDIIVADRLFAWDEGKRVAEPGEPEEFYHSLRAFDLEATWAMDAAYLARELDLAALSRARPPSKEAQRRWLLRVLHQGSSPKDHPERKARCPDWAKIVAQTRADGLVLVSRGELAVTDAGRELVLEDELLHPDGLPADPPLRVHVGAMATVSAVIEDPGIFDRMRRFERSTLGIEMEGAALGELASRFRKRSILVKAVQDHADGSKDDSFRPFACRAAAEFLFAFLEKHFEPEPEERAREKRFGPRDPRELDREREDPFLGRVERIAALRHSGATITRHPAESPFAGLLEVEISTNEFFDVHVVGALDRPITDDLFASFVRHVERPFRDRYPLLRSTLVHQGEAASGELRAHAFQRGVTLTTFRAYQGLFDISPYLAWQTARLENDAIYPPSIYVDQPATFEVSGGREQRRVDNALQFLWDLLATADQRRFALVLGEFGAGKTFLLRELCRRMAVEKHPVWPVLVEMEKLEKRHDLPALLAAHFAQADVPGYNFRAFRYMLEEGRIALLFDGFDELADRVTYDTVLSHFDTVLSAAQGGHAKVVLSSRRQHFLSEQQVKLDLTRRAEVIPGFHMTLLLPFEEAQIRRYLRNVLLDERAADERYALIDEVKDLLGLSYNPRMLGFIARIPESSLREAKKKEGTITAAGLYALLVTQWLDFEHQRSLRRGSLKDGISRAALEKGMSVLAASMWHARVKTVEIDQVRDVLVRARGELGELAMDADVLTHLFASGSLLVRDAERRFSFVHRSVMEWFVARDAAREIEGGAEAGALEADEMSPLMADFFHSLAGRQRAIDWAKGKVYGPEKGIAAKNATLVLQRLGESFERVNFAGQDLRGKDFTGVDWRGADLRGTNLEGATLVGADLSGANLEGAHLSRANLERVKLAGARLGAADLSFARLLRADLGRSEGLEQAKLWATNLAGASGVPEAIAAALQEVGGVPPIPGQTTPVCAAAISPCNSVAYDGRGGLLAAGYEDGTVRVFDAGTGELLRVLVGHSNSVWSVAWSPDGKVLASGSDDKTVRLWDVAAGSSSRVLEGHADVVSSVAWSPDGKALASGSSDKTVRLWDVAAGSSSRVLEGHADVVATVAWSPDGKVLASGSEDNTVRLWDVAAGSSSLVLEGHADVVFGVAWSPDGKALASGSDDRTVRIWDVTAGRSLLVLEGHANSVLSVAWSPDGKALASGSADDTVRLWDVAAGRSLCVLEGHANSVLSVAWSPDGKALASGSSDNTVRLWDVAAGRSSRVLEGHADVVFSVAWSPDGKTLACGSYDKTVRLWDVAAGRSLRVLEGHADVVASVAWSPDGKALASGSYDKTVRLWDVAAGSSLLVLEGHADVVSGVAWSPDGKALASGSSDNTVRLWDVEAGSSSRVLEGHANSVWSVAWSPDGKALASGSLDKTVRLWDVASGSSSRILEGHTNLVLSIAWSPDGKALASGSSDKTVRLWDVAAGGSSRVLEGHADVVFSVAWSPDGKALASGSYDKTVRLWDVATGRSSRVLEGHATWVSRVAWSPDGKALATGSLDNTLRLWDVATGACLAVFLATRDGWVAFTPDGRYKLSGNLRGSFWHVVGLCRFNPGELDEFVPHLRIPDDEPFPLGL